MDFIQKERRMSESELIKIYGFPYPVKETDHREIWDVSPLRSSIMERYEYLVQSAMVKIATIHC